jgi:putative resolvase
VKHQAGKHDPNTTNLTQKFGYAISSYLVLPNPSCCYRIMRIGEAAAYLNMSVVGVRKAASEGRLPSRRTGSGQRVFDRENLDVYLGRPTPESVPADRAEALYCRVSGSTGQESSLTNQERTLRESATGTMSRVYTDRGSGLRETRAGLNRMLDDAAKGHFTVVRVVWRDRLARSSGGVDRALPVGSRR